MNPREKPKDEPIPVPVRNPDMKCNPLPFNKMGKEKEYNMSSNIRSVVLIINNYEFPYTNLKKREGTNTDAERLVDLFKWLGLYVIHKDNLTACQIDAWVQVRIMPSFFLVSLLLSAFAIQHLSQRTTLSVAVWWWLC